MDYASGYTVTVRYCPASGSMRELGCSRWRSAVFMEVRPTGGGLFVSRSDLRALFRSNNRELQAEDVFADREDEWAAVSRSLARVVSAVRDPSFDVEDLEAPRRNVLVFYGVGGIGKTSLSRRIATHLTSDETDPTQWSALDPALGRVLPVRLDLSAQSGTDFEALVLSLRVAAASLGQSMPAFDLAFTRYWHHNHPGESLDGYLRRHTFFSRLSSSIDLSDQMQSALSEVAQALLMPGTIGSLLGQTLKTVVRGLRDHRREVRTLASCRRLADLLEAEPDQESLSYYTHLLAWDLAQLTPNRSATLTVLLDTFEDVGDRTHRDLERLVQRIAWLMPNALFVITGRNRLQWDDEKLEGQLDWVGSRFWPLLAPGAGEDPRQHRIGYLSAQDSEHYLCRRLIVNEQPLMNEPTRRLIISRSHGLPLYLDLAVMRFLDLYHHHGHAPDPEEFNHEFPALVTRIFRDLTRPERQVLRAVSLLDSFSVPLASAAAGLVHDSPVLRLIERPFIETEQTAPWPYSLHDLVRSAIREADSTTEDRWSPADWSRAAHRTFTALGEEFHAAQAGGDRRRLMSCLRQGLRVARDFDLDLGWLGDAAYAYVTAMIWEPVELPSGPGEPTQHCARPAAINTAPDALAVTLTAIARRQRQHRELTASALREVLASDCLPEPLRELPTYFLAESNRDLGRLAMSMDGMRQVADSAGRLAPDARRGLLHLARRLGRFPDVLAAAETLGPEGRKHRSLGDLWWPQGSIALACASYAHGRDEAEGQEQHGEAALSQACLAFAAAFQDRTRAHEQIRRAHDMLTSTTMRWAELQVRNAELVRDAGADPTLPERAAALIADAEAGGLTSSVAYARYANCFHAAVLGGDDAQQAALTELQRSVNGAEFAYLVELSCMMMGREPDSGLPPAEWVNGPDETRARWQQLVNDRRQELNTTAGG